ncbi:MAG: hypothetical protein MUF19_02745 [Candidatus Pacebacteria bacterium]|jgi:peptidoglycan hydrolase-like protein with peptidoglycan-binding domain|nr:hypothetical protein [Candidatus Paceibacterota bacterium]
MTVANTFASKALVAVVAAAMIFSAFVAPAKAATAEELQKMINDLMAQMNALQGQGGTSSSVASGVCPFTWTRDLKTGATGADVMKLQQFLNANADTRVAASGAGSVGAETEFFGPATAAAVSKFQVMHRADILTPAGLTNPTGFFGPSTRAKVNALCVAGGATDEDEDEDDEDTASGDLSGEASLNTIEIADGDESDEVEEGSEDIAVAEITVEFEDGDASISRLDLALERDSGENGDVDPWDVFQTVTLWVDGDMVAEFDASNEDDYLDEDDGSIRFAGLDIVAMEDEELVITVGVTVNESVDGVAAGDDESWNIGVGAIRFFDADGVATTEDDSYGNDLIDISGTTLSSPIAEFNIEEAGAGDDLDLESSNEDPDATTIGLDEDDNTEAGIFAFELSAEDSDGDVVLNEITVYATSTVASNMDDLVNDFRLEIGGDSFDAESYTGTGSTVTLVFDIDGDFTIDADAVETAMLYADFEDMESNDEGSTIQAQVLASGIDAEGDVSGEDVAVDGSSVSGEVHTLRTEGIDVEVTEDSATSETIDGADNDFGEYEIEVEISAFGEDAYIANTGANAFTYQIENSSGAVVATGTATSSTISSSADLEGSYYEIADGSTETFTFRVTFDPLAAAEGQDYRVQFLTVVFNDTADTNTPSTETLSPASDYETGYARISD